jgi:formylglycine-generating enzyme required for sulfatase activity
MADASEPRRSGPLRLHAILLPRWSVFSLSALLLAGAVGLPWLATWQGVLRRKEVAGAAAAPKVVQLRPELVELPGGNFLMGSPPSEARRSDDEVLHIVNVAPFSICRTEVTLSQWEAVMGTRPNNCNNGCEDEHPVQRVSLVDTLRYLNRLTDMENAVRRPGEAPLSRCYDEAAWSWDRACTGYRLPTEAEWEYAARAGTQTAYSFGDDAKELCAYGNGADIMARLVAQGPLGNDCDDGYLGLAPVGKLKANRWGLYDVHGNVEEWVWDRYSAYPKYPEPGYAGPNDGDLRVLRGGSFVSPPASLRSSSRHPSEAASVSGFNGFRCARSVTSRG